jgi:hypothetical protein
MPETLTTGALTASSGILINADADYGSERIKIGAMPEHSFQNISLAKEVSGAQYHYFVDRATWVSTSRLGLTAGYNQESESSWLTANDPASESRGNLGAFALQFVIQTGVQHSGDVTIRRVGQEDVRQNTYNVASFAIGGDDLDQPTRSDWVVFEYSITSKIGSPTSTSGLHSRQGIESAAVEEIIDSPLGHSEENVPPDSPLHPLAMEFKLGVTDETPPTPTAVAMADRLLKSVATKARNSEISIDVDGAISFTIVAMDETLISGEFSTRGTLYAWHYEVDWSTQRAEIIGAKDISNLVGWLG